MSTWTVDQWKDMLEWAVLMFLIAFAFVVWLLDWYRERRAAAAPDLSAEGFDAVCDAVTEALGDAYDCTRAWSAWGYGTMSAADFSAVVHDGDRVAEIAQAAVDAYRAAIAEAKGAA